MTRWSSFFRWPNSLLISYLCSSTFFALIYFSPLPQVGSFHSRNTWTRIHTVIYRNRNFLRSWSPIWRTDLVVALLIISRCREREETCSGGILFLVPISPTRSCDIYQNTLTNYLTHQVSIKPPINWPALGHWIYFATEESLNWNTFHLFQFDSIKATDWHPPPLLQRQ